MRIFSNSLTFYEERQGLITQTTAPRIKKFITDLKSRKKTVPDFMDTADGFLQFIYELNVICYVEESENGQKFIHWSFRERSLGKMAPKIQTNCRYEIHYGLVPALNIGQRRKK